MTDPTDRRSPRAERRVLVLFAHPALEKSRVHRRLLAARAEAAAALPHVTVHDLYEAYPDFAIDVPREQALLLDHDVVVFQHPFYWYSTPPLLKQWEDLVLEHGWAYGREGKALHGRTMLSLVSAGGAATAYCPEGYNRFTVRQLLAPIEATARLCGLRYPPPYVIHGTHRLDDAGVAREAEAYVAFLRLLAGWPDAFRDPDAVANLRDHPALLAALAPGAAADAPAAPQRSA